MVRHEICPALEVGGLAALQQQLRHGLHIGFQRRFHVLFTEVLECLCVLEQPAPAQSFAVIRSRVLSSSSGWAKRSSQKNFYYLIISGAQKQYAETKVEQHFERW